MTIIKQPTTIKSQPTKKMFYTDASVVENAIALPFKKYNRLVVKFLIT
jgi:hypothetical protein